jgi:phenylacetate-CoA ligase
MPFIRYDTGDVGRFESAGPCACGRRTLRMAPVTGRMADTIRTRGGRLIHGEYFTHLLYDASGVREFQFVQETLDRYRLLLAGDPERDRDLLPRWREKILDIVGPGATLDIEFVERIPPLPSGKRRFTISRVDALRL